MSPWHWLPIAAFSLPVRSALLFLVTTFLVASQSFAQGLTLMPGERRQDVGLRERSINRDVSSGGLGRTEVDLGASRDGFVEVLAEAGYCTQELILLGDCSDRGPTTAFARAEFFTDFCIPMPGESDCSVAPSVVEDLLVQINFNMSMIGQLIADQGGLAKWGVTARVDDVNETIQLVQVASGSLGGKFFSQFITIARVPVEIPDYVGETVHGPFSMSVLVRRGHLHRFTISVATKAESGSRLGGAATSNFRNTIDHVLSGSFQVENVDFQVATSSPPGEPSELEERVADLEGRLALLEGELARYKELVELQFESVEGAFTDRIAELEEASRALQAQIDANATELPMLRGEIQRLHEELEALGARVKTLECGKRGRKCGKREDPDDR